MILCQLIGLHYYHLVLVVDVCGVNKVGSQVTYTQLEVSPWLPGRQLWIYICVHPPFSLFFSSSALFAFWLRSSVVSVLFSLISEILLREKSMIKFIFVLGETSSGLAHDVLHCVPGLTLPLGDANNFFFISVLSLSGSLKKKSRLTEQLQ